MISHLINQLQASVGNQFLSGGLVLMIIGALGVYLRTIPRKIWEWFLRTFTVSVETTSDDESFKWLMVWINKQSYVKRTRRLALKYLNEEISVIPSKGHHVFLWNGRPVWLRWFDEEGKIGSADAYNAMFTRQNLSFRVLGRSRAVVETLLKELQSLRTVETTGKLKIYRRGGSWSPSWHSEFRDKRDMSSVFLPPQAVGVLGDMQRFLERRDWYKKVGVPYRRGYLFHGPPGNGKSASSLGFASALNIPLYVLNIATVHDDKGLEQAIFEVDCDAPSILLIEDIDTAIPDRDTDKTKRHFSLGTLLNLLDGVVARENLILIVTTNRPDVLDPALVRPGRIDRVIEFSNPNLEQVQAVTKLFRPGEGVPEEILSKLGTLSMAQVQEVLRS